MRLLGVAGYCVGRSAVSAGMFLCLRSLRNAFSASRKPAAATPATPAYRPPFRKAPRSWGASSRVASTMSHARLVRFSENFPQPRVAPDTTAETPLPSACAASSASFSQVAQVKLQRRKPSQNQRHLRLPPNHQSRQHFPAAIDPPPQLGSCTRPVPQIDPSPKS